MNVVQVESFGLEHFLCVDFPGVSVLADQDLPSVWGVKYYLNPVTFSKLSADSQWCQSV